MLTLLCLSITACGDTQATVPTPAQTNANTQPALLGSPLSAFDAIFGNRGSVYHDLGGSYTWNTKYGNLDLYITTLNSASFTDPAKNLVNALLFSFPYDASATSTPVLTNKAATELANQFLPPDAVHTKDVLSQSYKAAGEAMLIKMYSSSQLAKTLPASSFFDHYGTQLQKGLITILFSLNNEDKNQISEVIVQAEEDLPGGFNPAIQQPLSLVLLA
jgi:hypothetical protein